MRNRCCQYCASSLPCMWPLCALVSMTKIPLVDTTTWSIWRYRVCPVSSVVPAGIIRSGRAMKSRRSNRRKARRTFRSPFRPRCCGERRHCRMATPAAATIATTATTIQRYLHIISIKLSISRETHHSPECCVQPESLLFRGEGPEAGDVAVVGNSPKVFLYLHIAPERLAFGIAHLT